MAENNMPEWEASVMSDYRRIDLMRSEIARLSAAREKDAAELKEWVDKACNNLHELNVAKRKIAELRRALDAALLRERIES